MGSSVRARYTIGQGMALVAVFAVMFALPSPRSSTEVRVITSALASVLVLGLGSLAFDSFFGVLCPGCERWTMRRMARSPSYYRCGACRMRVRRTLLGFGPWLDASGPEDDARFRGTSRSGTWEGFSVPAEPGGSTSGALLRNKRLRADRRPQP
jgi:hypothetical protein